MGIDLTSLECAVRELTGVLRKYDTDLVQNDAELKKYMRSAAIQSFEYTYSLSLKMIRRYLEMSLDTDAVLSDMTFGGIIREAYKNGIICSELYIWKEYRKKRGITNHTYDEDRARHVFAGIPEFLKEAQCVLDRLQELNKSLD